MIPGGTQFGQDLPGNRRRKTGFAQYANAAVFGDRACRPTMVPIALKPGVSRIVKRVFPIEKSDQDVHVQ